MGRLHPFGTLNRPWGPGSPEQEVLVGWREVNQDRKGVSRAGGLENPGFGGKGDPIGTEPVDPG